MSKKFAVILITAQMLMAPFAASAQFNPHFIISDSDLMDYNSMGLSGIQKFLQGKGSFLANYVAEDIDGGQRTAAEMIYLAAQRYKISPKFILVTLQKEQSLVEDAAPSQYQLDWASGYGRCDSLAACGPEVEFVQKFRGFARQIDYAAGSMRFYLDNPDKSNFKVGQTSSIDGQPVKPINQATANLYAYTPHLHGNENFSNIWTRYFGGFYPDGSLLRDRKTREVFLITNGVKRKVTQAALASAFNPKNIIDVDSAVLELFQAGSPFKYTQYSLLRRPGGGIYLLSGNKLRPIASMDVFQNIGFSLDEVIQASDDDLKDYGVGPSLDMNSVYPTGALLQDKKDNRIYYVEGGIKYLIVSPEILKSNFPGRRNIIRVGADRLEKISDGEPLKFRDGELVRSDKYWTVYVISNGQRRPIPAPDIFRQRGYKWENVIVTSQKAIDIHPEGEPLQEFPPAKQ